MKRHLTLLFLLFLLCPIAATAQTTYVIERIDVAEGSRVPVQIVRSELRIEQERPYSEDEIATAVDRIRRLPFVFDVKHRLEATTTPMRWTLILEIVDMNVVSGALQTGIGSRTNEDLLATYDGALEGRIFLPSSGIFDLRLGTAGTSRGGAKAHGFEVSYTHYGILDHTGTFARVSIEQTMLAGEDDQPDWTPTITLGAPLTLTQTLMLNIGQSGRRIEEELEDFDDPAFTDVQSRYYELMWERDTTDDEIFMRRGTTLAFGPRWTRMDLESAFPSPDEEEELEESSILSDDFALGLRAAAYLPFGAQNSGFVRVRANGSRVDTKDLETKERVHHRQSAGEAHVGIARNLAMTPTLQSRLELSVGILGGRIELESGTITVDEKVAKLGWTLRRPSLSIGFIASYGWDND